MTTEYTGETISIEPHWEGLTEWNAVVFAEQGYEKFSYGPMASMLEAVRHLALTDPPALQRIIDKLNRRDEVSRARVTVRPRVEHVWRNREDVPE